jgi:hypothetical protein
VSVRAPQEGEGRFVLGFAAGALALVAAVGTFNAIVDPFGTVGTGLLPTAIESDRSQKITLLSQLHSAPDILILGSSRARAADPAYLRRLTGHTAFNAGVTSGDSVDEWVFARMLEDRFPDVPRGYLIFVNAGVGGSGVDPQLAADPRARPYLARFQRRGTSVLERISDYLSVQATEDSVRVVWACLTRSCDQGWFRPNGGLLPRRQHQVATRSDRLLPEVAAKVALAARRPLPTHAPPSNLVYFRRLLAFANARGSTPVVVLNPLHPALLRTLNRRGYPLHRWAGAYLRRLHAFYRFVVIDLTDVRTFGGSAREFADPTHVTSTNMRRMLAYIVAHDGGEL